MKVLISAAISLQFIFSCSSKSQNFGVITINIAKDSCYSLSDPKTGLKIRASRQLYILENALTDTVSLGFAVIPPGRVGDFRYLRIGKDVDKTYDPKTSNVSNLPRTEMICINLYQKRFFKGHLKIRYSFNN